MSFSTTSTNAILGLPLHIFIYSFNLTQLTFPHWCSNLSLLCTRPNHLKQLSFHLSSIGVILIFKWIFSSWILCASLDTRLRFAFLFFFFFFFPRVLAKRSYCSCTVQWTVTANVDFSAANSASCTVHGPTNSTF